MRYGYEIAVYGGAVLVSALVHGALIEGFSNAARSTKRERPPVVEVTVMPPPEPVEEAPVEVDEPAPKPPPPREPKPPAPPPEKTPPPSNAETQTTEESAPPVFGVTMSSTVAGGSGAKVRVGNTLMKDPEAELTPPGEVRPYNGPPKESYVPPSQVSKMAKRIGDCQGAYPDEAKRLGIEGRVQLVITIEKDGSVSSVTVREGLGYGLDEAAVAALKRCRFEPAVKDGEAVAIRVPYGYRFELDDY